MILSHSPESATAAKIRLAVEQGIYGLISENQIVMGSVRSVPSMKPS
jgi:hypothetical protein